MGRVTATKRLLHKYGYPPDLRDAAVQNVLQQAEALAAEWSPNADHETAFLCASASTIRWLIVGRRRGREEADTRHPTQARNDSTLT
jgi:hypothetical protein